MSDPANTAKQQQVERQGLVMGLITLPFRMLGVMMGSLFLSIVIECVGMHLLWKDEGWHHAQTMLEYELSQLSTTSVHSAIVQEPGKTASRVVSTGYEWVFIKSGLLERIEHAASRSRAPSQGEPNNFKYFISLAYVWAEGYLMAAAFTVLTFLVRVLVLVLTLPLFVMAAFTGFVDGLVRRDVRKFGAGRESGFIYHRAKAALTPLAVLPWVLYVAMPISIHPLIILLPSAILLGVAVSLTSGSFKKYL